MDEQVHASIDESHPWNASSDLSRIISQLSEQKCVHDLGTLLDYSTALEVKNGQQASIIRSHEEKAVAHSAELARLKYNYQEKQEDIIDSNARLLRKRDDERSALKQALTRQEDELSQAKTLTKDLEATNNALQERIKGQDEEIRKVEKQFRDLRLELEHAQKIIAEQNTRVKSKEQDLQAEKDAHERSKSELDRVKGTCASLEADLMVAKNRVQEIDELAPPLADSDIPDAAQRMQKVWKSFVALTQNCFRDGNPIGLLQDPSRWLTLSNLPSVKASLPLPPTNSHPAKRMRLFATLAILADELVRQIFTPSYLLEEVADLEKLMLEFAGISHVRESLFRRLLNSAVTERHKGIVDERVDAVQTRIMSYIEPLLSDNQAAKLRQDLREALMNAARVWSLLRKQYSYFAVEPETPAASESTWRSFVWNEEKKSFAEESTYAPKDVAVVLFPRIFMVKNEGEQEVFPGVVLMKSETREATEEWSKLPSTNSAPTRSGTSRGVGRRRATAQRAEPGSFLSANGPHEP